MWSTIIHEMLKRKHQHNEIHNLTHKVTKFEAKPGWKTLSRNLDFHNQLWPKKYTNMNTNLDTVTSKPKSRKTKRLSVENNEEIQKPWTKFHNNSNSHYKFYFYFFFLKKNKFMLNQMNSDQFPTNSIPIDHQNQKYSF